MTESVKWKDGVAGSLSGLGTRITVSPLDVIKIRLQLQVVRHDQGGVGVKYRGAAHALSRVIKEEGILGLWKGSMTAELLWAGYTGLHFGGYYSLQAALDQLERTNGQSSSSSRGVSRDSLCGGVAGGVATVCTYPLDLIRTRLAAQPEPKVYRGMTHAMKSVYRAEGFKGLYRGLFPTLLQAIPQSAIQFATKEAVQRLLVARRHRLEARNLPPLLPPSLETPISGFTAGCFSKLAVLPLDLTKKRMQVMGAPQEVRQRLQHSMPVASGQGGIKGIASLWVEIYRSEGVRGFFRGGVPSVLKASLQSAIAFSLQEYIRDLL